MSYRSDNNASYDHTLLSSVPGPTRQEKQEGYNVDLLVEGQDHRSPSPPANDASLERNGTVLGYSPGAVSFARKGEAAAGTTNDYEAVAKRVPWYRTRKGIIGIVVVVLVIIIAAAVGGGVGGSHHSHKNNTNATNGMGQSSNATQGVGQSGNSTATSTSSLQTVGGLSQVQGSSSPTPTPGTNRRGVA